MYQEHKKTNSLTTAQLMLIAGGLSLAFVGRSSAIEPIGDDAGIFVTGNASAAYNDNIFLSHTNPKSDEVFDFAPGLSYEFGKNNSLTKGKLAVWEDWQIYSTGSGLNNNFTNGVFTTNYTDSTTKLDFDAEFHQTDQAERDLSNNRFLINRDLEHMSATGEVGVTANSSLGSGIIFDRTDYKFPGYADWTWEEVPLNYYYKYDPKLDLSAGFRFRNNTLGAGGVDSRDYYYNIGARGEFTPNLSGEVDVGFNQQQMNNGSSQNGIGADANFTYAYSPKSNLLFGVNDDFGYDANGAATKILSPYVGFTSSLDDQWSINGRISYGRYSYITSSRQDNFYTVMAGVSYALNVNVSLGGSYAYNENTSTVTAAGFKNNIFSLTATVHY